MTDSSQIQPPPPSAKPPSGNRRKWPIPCLFARVGASPTNPTPPTALESSPTGRPRGTRGRFRGLGGPGAPGTPLGRPGPPRMSIGTKNQRRGPILRPPRGSSEFQKKFWFPGQSAAKHPGASRTWATAPIGKKHAGCRQPCIFSPIGVDSNAMGGVGLVGDDPMLARDGAGSWTHITSALDRWITSAKLQRVSPSLP